METSIDGSGDLLAEESIDSQQMNLKATAFVPSSSNENTPSAGSFNNTSFEGSTSLAKNYNTQQHDKGDNGLFNQDMIVDNMMMKDLQGVNKMLTMNGQPASRRKRHYRKNKHKFQQEQFQQIMMPFDTSLLHKNQPGSPNKAGKQKQQNKPDSQAYQSQSQPQVGFGQIQEANKEQQLSAG